MRILKVLLMALALAGVGLGCTREPSDIAAPLSTTTSLLQSTTSSTAPVSTTTSTTVGPVQTACERALEQKYGNRVLSSAEMNQKMREIYKCNFSVFDDSLNFLKCEEFRATLAAKDKLTFTEVMELMPDGTDCSEYPSK